ncbi:MAG: phage tail tape measure protein [Ruminococcus sp.]
MADVFRIEIPVSVEDNTGPGVSSATRRMNQFDKQNEKVQKRLQTMNRTKYRVALEAVDKVSSVVGKVGTTVKGLAGKAWRVTMGVVDKATAPIRGIFNLLKNPILQAGAIFGITIGLKDTIQTFGTFEQTMSKVKAISMATADETAKLTAKAKEMGATTKFTAAEAGEAFTYMAMAGWKTKDMLGGIEGIMTLAAASGEDLATTSDIVTDALTAFHMEAKDAGHFADVLAVASSSANTNVGMMGETFKYVGAASGALGYSIEDVALGIGLMANSGIKASQAGTELNSIFTRLSVNTNGARDEIEKLGINFYKSDGSARAFGDVLTDLRKKTAGMTQQQRITLANTIAGQRAQAGLLAMLTASEKDYTSLTEAINDADGAAKTMSDTMLDNMQGAFTLLQSAADGAKIKLGERLAPYLRQLAEWLTAKMPKVEQVISDVMDTVDEKITWVKNTIKDFTGSDEWANADVWGKMKIAWDKIVAEPFSNWWSSTGRDWFTRKMSGLGETIGSGITAGLLALLGIDLKQTTADGKSVGGAFIDGFKKGFDTEKIGEALKQWAKENKAATIAIGGIIGFNLITGIANKLNGVTNLLKSKGSKSKGDGTTGLGGTTGSTNISSTSTTVRGTVVNVYGSKINDSSSFSSGGGSSFLSKMMPSLAGGAAGRMLLGGGGGIPSLLGGGSSTAAPLLLEGGEAAAGASGAASAAGGITGALGGIGTALGSGATTAAGAAAAGGGAVGGVIGGILGLISSGFNIFNGVQKNNEGDKKGAKTEFASAGSKIGMVGAGAAAGAGIGSVVPGLGTAIGALVGAGVGGIAAIFGGDGLGGLISDWTDEGGWMNECGKAIGGFFTQTLPDFFGKLWGGISDFFTQTLPSAIGAVGGAIGGFFTETVPGFFSSLWEGIYNFFTETVPYALGFVTGKIYSFFTETVPGFFVSVWNGIKTFFTDTLPTFISNVWKGITKFFTETVPKFFSDLWGGIKTFFTDTLPTFISNAWKGITTFFTETVPGWFSSLWSGIKTFFTDTLPTFASGVWSGITTFFTQTIPGWFTSVWDAVAGFVTDTIPTWANNIWKSITGFFSSIGDWIGQTFSKIGDFFTKGFNAGSGNDSKHAWGGIMNSPHYGVVAEDGPEAIIPLKGSKNARGLDIWLKAGQALGVQPFADGGIVGDAGAEITTDTSPAGNKAAVISAGGNTIDIKVDVNPEFVINGAESGGDIVNEIRSKMAQIADELSGELAERLNEAFSNMPIGAGGEI